MASIDQGRFQEALRGKSVSVADLAQREPTLRAERADLNGDGAIAGDAETGALFQRIDAFDRDGSRSSVKLTDAARRTTTPGRMVDAALASAGATAALRASANAAQMRPSTRSAPTPATPRSNDKILHVGMNAPSTEEVRSLRARGADVTSVQSSRTQDTVKVGARTYDLADQAQRDAFVGTLRLPADQSAKVSAAIDQAGSGGRDEMAQIARTWAVGERGGAVPSRLVMSGHSVGDGLWGDHNGRIGLDALGSLARAMPSAAKQVEDLNVAACYSGGREGVDAWRAIFPNVKTVMAYHDSAPGAYSGATTHLGRWEAATRGDTGEIRRGIVAGTRKGENVTVWSRDGGYDDGRAPQTLDAARARHQATASTTAAYFDGTTPVDNPQRGPLRDHYNAIQGLLQRTDLPADERRALGEERSKTIRMLFFTDTVLPRFQQAHASTVRAGFAAVGMDTRDVSRMSRRELLDATTEFERRASTSTSPEARRLLPLLQGLRDLSPSTIPDGWI